MTHEKGLEALAGEKPLTTKDRLDRIEESLREYLKDSWCTYLETNQAKMSEEELTDEWLGDVGFKYTQEERQPTKHWHLNLGWGAPNCRSCIEDLNIEVAGGAMHGDWFCWLRRGTRFSNNFVHVRHIKYRHELEDLITALTGTKWNPENCMYGNFYNDEIAATLRKKREEIPQPPESGGE